LSDTKYVNDLSNGLTVGSEKYSAFHGYEMQEHNLLN